MLGETSLDSRMGRATFSPTVRELKSAPEAFPHFGHSLVVELGDFGAVDVNLA